MEDGCSVVGSVFKFETVAPTKIVITPKSTESLTPKERRQRRVEALRAKRAARGLRLGRTSASPALSCDASVSSASTYTLTKDELRRKKNRESAERSRLRKLALIDFLSAQATAMMAQLHKLTVLNKRLRAGTAMGEIPSSDAQSDAAECGCDSDLSTLSGHSSPTRPSTPTSSFERSPAGTHAAHCPRAVVAVSAAVAVQSSLACSFHSADALDQFLVSASAPTVPLGDASSVEASVFGASATDVSAWSLQQDAEIDFFDSLLDFDLSAFPSTASLLAV